MRTDWSALPEAVTAQIVERIGGDQVIPASRGDHAEFAATVTGDNGAVFVKAASSDPGLRSLRYELRVGEVVHRPYSPAVIWHFEADSWLTAGFEHFDGPHADLSPGSPDLDLLAAILKELGGTPAPGGRPWFTPATRLGFTSAAMDGEALIHTDLNPANLIVTPRGLGVVDWAWATRAAPWVELALLVQWLIGSGHTPEQAETWLAHHPAWGAVAPQDLTDFAERNATKWSRKAEQSAAGWVQDLAIWTGRWWSYRCAEAAG